MVVVVVLKNETKRKKNCLQKCVILKRNLDVKCRNSLVHASLTLLACLKKQTNTLRRSLEKKEEKIKVRNSKAKYDRDSDNLRLFSAVFFCLLFLAHFCLTLFFCILLNP